MIAEILPELWLLHRHTSHIAHPFQSEHPAENLAVVASTDRTRPDATTKVPTSEET